MFRATSMTPLLGYKLGMTRVFSETGEMIPVTAIQADPCVVTQIRATERDGYQAVQIGTGAARHPKKPQIGHTKDLQATPQVLREFRTDAEFTVGQHITVGNLSIGDRLKLTGISKGKGFQGVIKRHGASRGPETHGSDHHRAPGSSGSMFPQHVLKGKIAPGRMGGDQVTVRKVEVVDIIADQNLILVKGPVPGSRGSLISLVTM